MLVCIKSEIRRQVVLHGDFLYARERVKCRGFYNFVFCALAVHFEEVAVRYLLSHKEFIKCYRFHGHAFRSSAVEAVAGGIALV